MKEGMNMTDTPQYERFLDDHQRATLGAAMARIIPSDDTPGASEAGTVEFLDRYLSGIGFIYAKPDGNGFEVLEGRQARAWMTRVEAARDKYVAGVVELDRISEERHASVFSKLATKQQDEVLRAVERPEQLEQPSEGRSTTTYGGPVEPALQQTSAEADLGFFPLLVTHTRQGFYCDPIYGGNRGQVGWQVVGFPGPASLAEVHQARYSTLDYFADDRVHPGPENDHGV